MEQCIDNMVQAWQNPKLHIAAFQGFKSTGICVALDGSEDGLIICEARAFWTALGLLSLREQLLLDVGVEVAEGRLAWTYTDVYKIIDDFPKTGELDVLKVGQYDEDGYLDVGGCLASI
jgi:hypothetical protein